MVFSNSLGIFDRLEGWKIVDVIIVVGWFFFSQGVEEWLAGVCDVSLLCQVSRQHVTLSIIDWERDFKIVHLIFRLLLTVRFMDYLIDDIIKVIRVLTFRTSYHIIWTVSVNSVFNGSFFCFSLINMNFNFFGCFCCRLTAFFLEFISFVLKYDLILWIARWDFKLLALDEIYDFRWLSMTANCWIRCVIWMHF